MSPVRGRLTKNMFVFTSGKSKKEHLFESDLHLFSCRSDIKGGLRSCFAVKTDGCLTGVLHKTHKLVKNMMTRG